MYFYVFHEHEHVQILKTNVCIYVNSNAVQCSSNITLSTVEPCPSLPYDGFLSALVLSLKALIKLLVLPFSITELGKEL